MLNGIFLFLFSSFLSQGDPGYGLHSKGEKGYKGQEGQEVRHYKPLLPFCSNLQEASLSDVACLRAWRVCMPYMCGVPKAILAVSHHLPSTTNSENHGTSSVGRTSDRGRQCSIQLAKICPNLNTARKKGGVLKMEHFQSLSCCVYSDIWSFLQLAICWTSKQYKMKLNWHARHINYRKIIITNTPCMCFILFVSF